MLAPGDNLNQEGGYCYINYLVKSSSWGGKALLGAPCTLYPHCQLYAGIHSGLFEILNIVGILRAELFEILKHGTEWPGWVCLMCIFFFPSSNHPVLHVSFLQWHEKLNAVSNLWHHKLVRALVFSLSQMSSTVWQLNQNVFATLYPKSLCIDLFIREKTL
jgi:hypothetical protein